MNLALRSLLLAALAAAALAGPAQAQSIRTTPSPFDRPAVNPFDQPAAPPGGGMSQAQGEQVCVKDFLPLRDEVEKRGNAVRAAGKRKATPQEACKLFGPLVAAQDKLRKYMTEHAAKCGIPAQIVKQANDGWKQTDSIRVKVCEAAARPAVPAGPSLSDALGTSRIADPTTSSRGQGGTFDTLTGTPLGRSR